MDHFDELQSAIKFNTKQNDKFSAYLFKKLISTDVILLYSNTKTLQFNMLIEILTKKFAQVVNIETPNFS